MASSVKRLQTSSEELNRVQDSFIPSLNAVLGTPIFDGRLVDALEDGSPLLLGTSFINVAHKLGRSYRGWFLVDNNASATVWVDSTLPDPNPDRSKFIRLRASAAATVKLWVF